MSELYRAKPGDGVAWVTGASSGIGRQIALDLAREGWIVAATARSEDKLADLVGAAENEKGRVIAFAGDVTDEDAMAGIVRSLEDQHGPIALAIFVAGNYWPVTGEAPKLETYKKTLDVNLNGVLNGLIPCIQTMRRQGFGQLAVVGSATAYNGLPLASAYGASKAALNNLAASLKFDLDKANIRIQVVNPGFVDTPLTEGNDFAMPFLVEVEEAARLTVRGLKTGGFEIAFPWQLATILKAINLLPHSGYFTVMKRAMGWDKRQLRDPIARKSATTKAAEPGGNDQPTNRYSEGSG